MKVLVYTPNPASPTYSVAPSGCGNATFKKAGEHTVGDEMAAYLLKNKSDLFASKKAPVASIAPKQDAAPVDAEKQKAKAKSKAKKED